jgi:hypothetical protein
MIQYSGIVLGFLALLGLFNVTVQGLNVAWFGVIYMISLGVYLSVKPRESLQYRGIIQNNFPQACCLFLVTFLYLQNPRLWAIAWIATLLLWGRLNTLGKADKN